MKKFLFVVWIAVMAQTSCKKDLNPKVVVTPSDIAGIKAQLKGSWVFPVKTLRVVDSSGKDIVQPRNEPGAAFEFDGISKVIIRPDAVTSISATYTVSTINQKITLQIVKPDNSVENYKVLNINNQTLAITSTEPYIYYNGTQLIPTTAQTNTVLQKLTSADVSGNYVRVNVNNDSIYNVKVSVVHTGQGGAGALVGSKSGTTGHYTTEFVAQSGDHLVVDVIGSIFKTSINAYFRGLPITGNISASNNETITTTGWTVQFKNASP